MILPVLLSLCVQYNLSLKPFHVSFSFPISHTHTQLIIIIIMRSIGELVIKQQSSPPLNLTATSSSRPLFMNYALISALAAFALAQSIKVFTTWYKEHRWDLKQLIGSGGMPSSHSATVTALAVAVGLHDGLGGSTFATALILACIVMYDATGVRLHAGRQAEVLNQIVFELPAEHPLAESRPLRELLGHTPPQVIMGILLGTMTAIIIYLLSIPSSSA